MIRHFRCNLASALGAIVFVAVGFTALREADQSWDRWLLRLTLGLLLFAVLLAVRRAGDRRAFWIGFALFGWGYLGLSQVPSIEPRLISTKALSYLQLKYCGTRMYVMRVIPDLDRSRAHNLSRADLLMATAQSYFSSPEQEQLREENRTLEEARGTHVLGLVTRYNKPEQFENIILRASPDGEILRLKDVAKVELGSSFFMPDVGTARFRNFIHIGHTLLALLAAWLGGVLFRWLGSASVTPEVPTEGE